MAIFHNNRRAMRSLAAIRVNPGEQTNGDGYGTGGAR